MALPRFQGWTADLPSTDPMPITRKKENNLRKQLARALKGIGYSYRTGIEFERDRAAAKKESRRRESKERIDNAVRHEED